MKQKRHSLHIFSKFDRKRKANVEDKRLISAEIQVKINWNTKRIQRIPNEIRREKQKIFEADLLIKIESVKIMRVNLDFLSLRQTIEQNEKRILAPYACHAADTQGREYEEAADVQRTAFQRDRDRVIHCRAYRRLRGKTQVFVAHHGDHYRNRLTHTMEVAQLGRDIARNLRANEDLTETIALAHDIGHTPFGHAGETAMNELLHRFGGFFEHNSQSRRIVEKLEQKSPDFPGLNLSYEVRDGLIKHRNTNYDTQTEFRNSSLEAQIVDMADQIAYQNHDIDDGIRSKIVELKELEKLELWQMAQATVPRFEPEHLWISAVISSLIKLMSNDLLTETVRRLESLSPHSVNDIRNAPLPMVAFSPEMEERNNSLRHFLYSKFYRQPEVLAQSERGKETIKRIFFHLHDHPQELPQNFQEMIENGEKVEIVIKDFIAGMTDRFALDFAGNLPHDKGGKRGGNAAKGS